MRSIRTATQDPSRWRRLSYFIPYLFVISGGQELGPRLGDVSLWGAFGKYREAEVAVLRRVRQDSESQPGARLPLEWLGLWMPHLGEAWLCWVFSYISM